MAYSLLGTPPARNYSLGVDTNLGAPGAESGGGSMDPMTIAGIGVGAASLFKSLFGGNKDAELMKEAAVAGTHTKQQVEEIKHMPPALEGSASAEADMQALKFFDYSNMSMGQGYLGDNGVGAGLDTGAAGPGGGVPAEAAEMMEKTRKATLLKIKHLGIDDGSGANPYGVSMSADEWVMLNKAKDPKSIQSTGSGPLDSTDHEMIGNALKAMGKQGTPDEIEAYSMLIDMYYDPQLAGETLDALAGTQRNLTPAEIQEKRKAIESMQPMPGEDGAGFAGRQNAARQELDRLLVGGGTNPEKVSAINTLKSMGVLDSQNHQSRGQLRKHINLFYTKGVKQASVMNPTSPEENTALMDQYQQYASKQVDPKLVKTTHIGDGLTRTVVMNSDGTTAVSFLDGEVKFPDGSATRDVTILGSSGQDWAKFASLAEGAKPKAAPKPKAPKAPKDPRTEMAKSAVAKPPAGYTGAPLEGPQGSSVAADNPMANAMSAGPQPYLAGPADLPLPGMMPPGLSKTATNPMDMLAKGGPLEGLSDPAMPGMPGTPSGPGGSLNQPGAALGQYTQLLLQMLNDPNGAAMLEQMLAESMGGMPPGYEGAPLEAGA